ncbi:MAG: hypothetical protein AB2A00_32805, partial [Myxococcota bacterium]
MRPPARILLAGVLLVLPASVGLVHAARAKVKPAAEPVAPAAPVEPPPPVEVPALASGRADGLRVVWEELPGPAVSARLVLRLDRLKAEHPTPGAAAVVASTALFSGPHAGVLAAGGAGRGVVVEDNSVVVGVDSLRERWKDDVGALISAVSQPPLTDAALNAARHRLTSFGPAWELDDVFRTVVSRVVTQDVALALGEGVPPLVTVDSAVWHVEEAWSADRMVLVGAGPVPPGDLEALLQRTFLVPVSAPDAPTARDPEPAGPLADDVAAIPPGYLAYGQRARALPPADAVVLAELVRLRLEEQTPQAAECEVRYLPSASEPSVVALCLGAQGTALDVREALGAAWDPKTMLPAKPAELAVARKIALGRLQADRATAVLLAARLARWAAAGLDGGLGLERAVAATTDASLGTSLETLLRPER